MCDDADRPLVGHRTAKEETMNPQTGDAKNSTTAPSHPARSSATPAAPSNENPLPASRLATPTTVDHSPRASGALPRLKRRNNLHDAAPFGRGQERLTSTPPRGVHDGNATRSGDSASYAGATAYVRSSPGSSSSSSPPPRRMSSAALSGKDHASTTARCIAPSGATKASSATASPFVLFSLGSSGQEVTQAHAEVETVGRDFIHPPSTGVPRFASFPPTNLPARADNPAYGHSNPIGQMQQVQQASSAGTNSCPPPTVAHSYHNTEEGTQVVPVCVDPHVTADVARQPGTGNSGPAPAPVSSPGASNSICCVLHRILNHLGGVTVAKAWHAALKDDESLREALRDGNLYDRFGNEIGTSNSPGDQHRRAVESKAQSSRQGGISKPRKNPAGAKPCRDRKASSPPGAMTVGPTSFEKLPTWLNGNLAESIDDLPCVDHDKLPMLLQRLAAENKQSLVYDVRSMGHGLAKKYYAVVLISGSTNVGAGLGSGSKVRDANREGRKAMLRHIAALYN